MVVQSLNWLTAIFRYVLGRALGPRRRRQRESASEFSSQPRRHQGNVISLLGNSIHIRSWPSSASLDEIAERFPYIPDGKILLRCHVLVIELAAELRPTRL